MGNSTQLKQFLADYQKYAAEVLTPTLDEINRFFESLSNMRFEHQRPELSRLATPSPLRITQARIKRPESVVDKILRKPSLFPEGLTLNSVARMKDAVAGRVIVYFLSSLQLVDREIRNNEMLEISPETPPLAGLGDELVDQPGIGYVNSSNQVIGSASIIYTVRFKTGYLPKEKRPWFELQVKTLTAHLWREIQHVLGYKPNKRTAFSVSQHFQIIESQLDSLDEHFNLLFEELLRYQETARYKSADILNAENLPSTLTELGIGCAQREIDGLLKLLTSRGVTTIGELKNIATPQRRELINLIYSEQERRLPGNFEMVASLAAIKNFEDQNQMIDAIKTQLEFLHTWRNLKKTFGVKI